VNALKQPGLWFLVAESLFLLSLVLPAYHRYGTDSGWQCAMFAGEVMFTEFKTDAGFWSWLYYLMFNVTNFCLLVLPILWWFKRSRRVMRVARWLVGLAFLHTLSWVVVSCFDQKFSDVRVGYYVWLLSVAALWRGCVLAARETTETSTVS